MTANKPVVSFSTNADFAARPWQAGRFVGQGCVAGIEAAGYAAKSKKPSEPNKKDVSNARKKIRLVCLWIVILAMTGVTSGALWSTGASKYVFPPGTVFAETGPGVQENDDLQWFKDQMEISEKYIQEQDGVWGMSWGHFFTMVFLVLFALGALVVFVQRQRRTREILEIIRKEMQHGDSG